MYLSWKAKLYVAMTKVIVRIAGTTRAENKVAIHKALEQIRSGIINDMSVNNRNASKKFIRSLDIKDLRDGSQLVGEDYSQQLVAGRKPGRFPPTKAIEDWIDAKGLSLNKIKKKSLAFIIARKIANKGTDIFKGKRKALNVKGIVDDVEPTLKEEIVKNGKIAIKTGIAKALGATQHLKLQP